MRKVLFVCLGNVCRSPIAEGIFQTLVVKKGLSDKISCDSAGTTGYHAGQLPDHRAIEIAISHGIKLTHLGRKLSTQDLDNFDHIVVMDEENFKEVHTLYYQVKHKPPSTEKLFLLGDYDPMRANGKIAEIPDPFYGDKKDFENVYEQILRCNEALLQHFIEKYHWQK